MKKKILWALCFSLIMGCTTKKTKVEEECIIVGKVTSKCYPNVPFEDPEDIDDWEEVKN